MLEQSTRSERGSMTGEEARRAVREGRLSCQTSSLAPGYVQGNLVVLPQDIAGDFLRFCQRNPKPCPIIGMTEPGDPHIPDLGVDLDLRTDLPGYRVWRDGELVEEPGDLLSHWRDDLVGFVIGCSFSFEEALLADGLEVRNVAEGVNVSMFRTSIPCAPAGPFAGPVVVTMRPFSPADAIRAIQITSRFPSVHGAPIHIGQPEQIGIRDLSKPDYGDPVAIRDGELPVFWACGVTPQAVIAAARPPFAITHAPGAMLVTDLKNSRLSIL
ncbi:MULTISPECIES: putative hydro-lyase [Bosea]|jgi:uncharacterized protein YcsI (UPF0317 family)|uniref:Putative hydro-lyase RKE40_01780 n=1 Tax=Bosea rubneri TaxID=3075434 RepID=A0ABU3S1C3_9HYPH|nr:MULTISPECIES: putative hydro-lyase [unclassified Bosea (in: a-proteobacteria)]MDU0338589.1 putative hydro-lyase [Bosea sp. ZW T0_25]HEV7339982.1 putative hydro-lyase [Bosea sp. (in: a-proteobacteria)]